MKTLPLATALILLVSTAVASAKPPSNDHFNKATVIGSLPFSTIEDPTGATAHHEPQPIPFTGNCNGSGATVWWQFTPASSSTLNADTSGSTFNNGLDTLDTVLAVYTRSGNQFTEVACNDDASGGSDVTSSLSFSATAGTTYYFQVGACCSSTATWPSSPELDFNLSQ